VDFSALAIVAPFSAVWEYQNTKIKINNWKCLTDNWLRSKKQCAPTQTAAQRSLLVTQSQKKMMTYGGGALCKSVGRCAQWSAQNCFGEKAPEFFSAFEDFRP
jgi:hypothetical protein